MKMPEEIELAQEKGEIHFSEIVTIPLAATRNLLHVEVEAKRNRLAVVSLDAANHMGGPIQVLIVFDWATEPLCVVNIDLEMEYVRTYNLFS